FFVSAPLCPGIFVLFEIQCQDFICVLKHGPELDTFENLPAVADPVLPQENSTPGICAYQYPEDNHHNKKEGQGENGKDKVEAPLDKSVKVRLKVVVDLQHEHLLRRQVLEFGVHQGNAFHIRHEKDMLGVFLNIFCQFREVLHSVRGNCYDHCCNVHHREEFPEIPDLAEDLEFLVIDQDCPADLVRIVVEEPDDIVPQVPFA